MERTKETNIFQDLSVFLQKWGSYIFMFFVMGIGLVFIFLGNILADPLDCIYMSIYGFGFLFLAIIAVTFKHVCYLLRKPSAEADKNKNENKE